MQHWTFSLLCHLEEEIIEPIPGHINRTVYIGFPIEIMYSRVISYMHALSPDYTDVWI